MTPLGASRSLSINVKLFAIANVRRSGSILRPARRYAPRGIRTRKVHRLPSSQITQISWFLFTVLAKFYLNKNDYIALSFKKSRFPCLSMCLSSRQQFTTAKNRWFSKTRNSPNQPELVDSLRQLIVRSQFLSFLERFNDSIEPWVAPSTDNDSFVPSSWLSIPLSVSVWTLILYVTDPMFIRFSQPRTILLREFKDFFFPNLLVYFPGFLGILWYLEMVRGSHCEDEVPALLMDGYAVVVVNFILRYRHLLEMLPVDDDICRQSVTEWCYFE